MFLALPGKQATFSLILSLSTGKETVMADCLLRRWTVIHLSYTDRWPFGNGENEQNATMNLLCNDIRDNSKIRYNVNPVCTKLRGPCISLLTVPCFSLGKYTFLIFIRIVPPRRFYQILKTDNSLKNCSKVSVIHALEGSISSFSFFTANSI